MELVHISKKEFNAIPSENKSIYQDYDGLHPQRAGRRVAFLHGHGNPLLIEGIHFIVDRDQSHLPVLCKENAEVGAMYQGAGGPCTVTRVYQLTDAEAAARDLIYLERAEARMADGRTVEFALPGSAIAKGILSVNSKP